jgi:hypothetical protein
MSTEILSNEANYVIELSEWSFLTPELAYRLKFR